MAEPGYLIYHPAGTEAPFQTTGPKGYTPSQIRHAYGFDQISFPGGVQGDGTGTTIAIVDAYDDPNTANDLHQFDLRFNLPDPPSFTKVNQTGGSQPPPANSGWAGEIVLDVEWAHAIAPGANILLVEANDDTTTNLFAAVAYAASQPGVDVVSMSWGGSESRAETSLDNYFLTPAGHTGITFVGATGDNGAPPGYPETSPNVLAVGGTTLQNLDAQGDYPGTGSTGEIGWSGSTGGISRIEPQPTYQQGVVTQSSTRRTNPDVAYDADPSTGFPVYDSYNNGTATPWEQVGGTSAGTPQWAALIAIADQGRLLAGKGTLDGRSQTLPMLYALPAADFHDITTGTSLGFPHYSAQPGYDLVTGLGTPVANRVVADLVGNLGATHFLVSAPTGATAGAPLSVTVTALNQNNQTVSGYTGTVHFTSSDLQAGLPANYTFTAADAGSHTFTVTFKTAGTQSLTVTDTANSSLTGSQTGITVGPAAASTLVLSGFPTAVTAGTPGSVTVTAQDPNGNTATGYAGTVHFTSSDGQAVLPADYTFTAADAGTHTFSVILRTPGSQSITATDTASSSLTGTQPGITVNPAAVVGTGSAITAVEGASFTSPVATFTDPGGAEAVANYSAVIDWGDGTTSAGTISFAGTPGSTTNPFTVSGSHLYSEESASDHPGSNPYTVAVTLHHLSAPNTVVTTTAVVSDPAVAGTGVNWTANQGVAFTRQAVATFTDPGGAESPADYAATIDWGDGSAASAGTITSNSSGVFTVRGDHTYAAAGTNTLHVTISHEQAPNTVVTGTAVVAATQLAVTTQPPGSVTAGSGFGLAVSAENLNGNVLTGFTGSVTVALSSNPGGSTLGGPLTATAVNGVATFAGLTLNKVGTGYTLQAASGGLTAAATNPFTVTAGAATQLAVTVQPPGRVTPGTPFGVTVTAEDADGNTATGYTGTIHFTSTDPLATLPADYPFTSADAGTHTFPVTLMTAGTQSVTATDTVTSSLTGTSTGITVNGSLVLALDAGGGAAGSFAADADYSGGQAYSTGAPINTGGVSNPAPQAVYDTERYGNFAYTVPGLTAGAAYTVRLHFAELYWSSAGARLFDVAINGAQVLSNFDIFATAGGKDIAVVEQFTATADSAGKLAIQFTSVKDNAKVSGIEILTAAALAVSAPTGVTASAGDTSVSLTWAAFAGATSYNLYRSSNSGAEGSTPYRTGITANSFTDTGLSNGTTYYYQVTAVSSGGESARSAEVSATPQASGSLVLALDAGGGAAGRFTADADFSGGQVYSTSAAIATGGVSNPAPQAVYDTERYGNFAYTVPGLTPGAAYTVRLHFAELYWSSAGARLFDVAINGAQVLSAFDIFATAGGKDIAVVEQFTATADSAGRITIQFTSVKDNAKVSGIEILAGGPS